MASEWRKAGVQTTVGSIVGLAFGPSVITILAILPNVAYGRLYGEIFGVFYLGSGPGVLGLSFVREAFENYDTGLFIAAGILLSCVVLTAFLSPYKYAPLTR